MKGQAWCGGQLGPNWGMPQGGFRDRPQEGRVAGSSVRLVVVCRGHRAPFDQTLPALVADTL